MQDVIIKTGGITLSAPESTVVEALLQRISKPAPLIGEPATLHPPRLGEPWPGQGGVYAGLMRGENGQPDYHLIVSKDRAAYIESIAWGGFEIDEPGAASDFDGAANTRALVESEADHPAAEWAAELEIEGHADFYLPARRELRLCWVNVPELFADGYYWTSTQYSAHLAWGQSFGSGYQGYGHKGTEYRARAVRRLLAI